MKGEVVLINFETFYGDILPLAREWERELTVRLQAAVLKTEIHKIAGWEIQSQLATLTLVSLVALVSIWVALAVMLVWSWVTVIVYCHNRKKGFPDLLQVNRPKKDCHKGHLAIWLAHLPLRIWLAGLQAFVFTRFSDPILERRKQGRRALLVRSGILLFGLIYFGVTTHHHILEKAGFSERQVLQLSLIGSCLSVPYRILISALVINTLTRVLQTPAL